MKSIPWIICLAFAIIIILMIVFKKPPPDPPVDLERERRLKEYAEAIKGWESKYDTLLAKKKADSLAYYKSDSVSKRKISRLTIRLNAINTTKATSKELDSLIKVLYE